jgi:hypothetical protein
MVFRNDVSQFGHRAEGISADGGTPNLHKMLLTNGDVGSITGYAAGVITNSNGTWTTDRWIGARVMVWNSTKSTFNGFSTVTDNDGTTLTVVIVTGADLDTTASSTVVDSPGSTFQSAGVIAGDLLEITTGSDAGTHIIHSVDSETQLTLTAQLTATSTESFRSNFINLPVATDIYELRPLGMAGVSGAQVTDFGIMFQGAVDLPDPELEWIQDRRVGSGREVALSTQGKYVNHGSISGRLRVPRPLFYALGQDSVAGAVAPFTHTMTVASKLPSFIGEATLEDTADFVRYYRGCKLNSLKLTGGIEEPLIAEAEIYCTQPDDASPNPKSTVVYDSNTGNFNSGEGYMFNEGSLSYLGMQFASVQDFEYTITNNLIEKYYFTPEADALFPQEIFEGNADHELNITVRPEDKQLFTELLSPTSGGATLVLSFTRTASNDTLTLTFTGCRQKTAPHPLPEENPLEVEVNILPESVTAVSVDNKSSYMV